ncbi:hypothetical protein FAM22021_001003 [Propionibacterium freudenreichii]|nr:hypothetical protein [Propionibacterium freudenreichii]
MAQTFESFKMIGRWQVRRDALRQAFFNVGDMWVSQEVGTQLKTEG